MLPEDQLIARIRHALAERSSGALPRLVPGDDAAVVAGRQGRHWVISCDACLEGVHFRTDWHPPRVVGYRALARAASDLAAMGAEPAFFLLSLALPRHRTGRWLNQMLAGLRQAARQAGLRLLGGDTTAQESVALVLTVIGFVRPGGAVLRCTARPGDRVYVSGRLGAAQLGLEILRRGLATRRTLRPLIRAHFYPPMRIRLGTYLASRRLVSAMMDLSDGLSTDLARLTRASRVGARVFLDRLPRPVLPRVLRTSGLDPLRLALHGGEDYELLFTVPAPAAGRLPRQVHGVALHPIGEIVAGDRVELVAPDGTIQPLEPMGWDPFRR